MISVRIFFFLRCKLSWKSRGWGVTWAFQRGSSSCSWCIHCESGARGKSRRVYTSACAVLMPAHLKRCVEAHNRSTASGSGFPSADLLQPPSPANTCQRDLDESHKCFWRFRWEKQTNKAKGLMCCSTCRDVIKGTESSQKLVTTAPIGSWLRDQELKWRLSCFMCKPLHHCKSMRSDEALLFCWGEKKHMMDAGKEDRQ